MIHRIVNPAELPTPSGFSHGIRVGETVHLAGQTALDADMRIVEGGMVAQFRQALGNLLTTLAAAGGTAQDLVSLTIYLTDVDDYQRHGREIGAVYRELVGDWYPTMAGVGVTQLWQPEAVVEIQGVAMIKPPAASAADAVPVVTRAGAEHTGTGQSGGAVRVSGVSPQHTPAQRIWFGQVSNEPGFRSLPHHHGEAETGGYVLRGTARIYFGEQYATWVDMGPGDFVFVPPMMPHVEVNMSTTEELVWLTCRTPDNIVVNLPEVDDAVLDGYRRA
jgi:enamine deaminase RidA (YjgF/YER057c/UK114 family)/uncharacterized RmlC-like cupin family protein